MSRLALYTLGSPRLERDGVPVPIRRRRVMALLVYLAVTGRTHRRDTLAALFYPEHDQRQARARLRRTLSTLKQALGEGWLHAELETVRLNQEGVPLASDPASGQGFWLDAAAFQALQDECRSHGHPQDQVCPACLPLLSEAAALYRDDFLAGFSLRDSPGFDDWQSFQTTSLLDQLASALERLADGHGSQGQFQQAVVYARRWAALDPLNEPTHRCLMQLYAQSGQRAAALQQYAECEKVLAKELNVSPQEETVQLLQAIQAGGDLGPPMEMIASSATAQVAERKGNLPVQLTPFVGREKEMAAIGERLQNPDCRLLTLVGPGGIGKTRLAVEATKAHEDSFSNGVFFCPLAPLQSADAIVPTVAQTLGFSFYEGAEPRQQLLDYLRHKGLLLVMDNFEHLLACPDQRDSVGLVTDLLKAAPAVKVVVTSRVRLNVQEEHLFPVPGMSVPEERAVEEAKRMSERFTRHSAIALFLFSVRRVRPEFRPTDEDLLFIARICWQVQGVPLAIVLAAAWAEMLTPAEIAAEIERGLLETETLLRDLPERQRSMRAVYNHSWRLLSEREQAVFAALSVFRGGFTRQAAQEVTGASLLELMALVNRSLLHRSPRGRYQVHELLRQYAAERLAGDPEAGKTAHDRHCGYYAEFLRQREGEIMGGKQRTALLEIDNIRAAWCWAVQQGKAAEIRASCLPLFWIGMVQGWYDEMDALFGRAADALRKDGPVGEKGIALGLALVFQSGGCLFMGHYNKAVELVREGLSILQKLGARRELVWGACAAVLVGAVADPAEVEQLLQESLTIATEMDNRREMAYILNLLGAIANNRGADKEAETYLRKALQINRRLQSSTGLRMSLTILGDMALARRDYAEAGKRYRESLTHARKVGSRTDVAFGLDSLGDVALAIGEHEKARIHYQESLAMQQEMGLRWTYAYSFEKLGNVALAVGDGQGAKREYRQALQAALDSQDLETSLGVLSGLAILLAQECNRERSLELVALILRHPSSMNRTKDAAKGLLDNLSAQLPPGVVAAAQERGRQRDPWATVEELLAELEEQQGPAPL